MRYRELGKTGIRVSEIGFGAWGIGGLTNEATSYGATDDYDSARALRRAFDCGITFYDTSDLYGYGHSEELIGAELHLMRERIVLASKVGFLEHKGPFDFSRKHVRAAISASLRRLRTDYLDLYQLHSPPIELLRKDPGILDTFRELKEEGRIRAFGLSVKNPEDGVPAICEFGFKVIQINFNLVDQRALENGFLDLAQQKNVGVIVRTPLCFGFLTGRIKDLRFDPRDHRATWSEKQLQTWADAPNLFSFLNQGRARTPAQMALQYCLSFPSVSTAVPGILYASEAAENARASDLGVLGGAELQQIRQAYENHTFFHRGLKPTGIRVPNEYGQT